jgi:hypothetical protein
LNAPIVSGQAFQNTSPLNAPPLRQVMLFKMPAIRMQVYCTAFQNARHLNAPPLHQAMPFKIPAI